VSKLAPALVFALAVATGGCLIPVLHTVDHNTQFNATSPDAVVVFGFSARLNVWIYKGVDDGVNLHCNQAPADVRRARPEEGFIVMRLPARTGKEKYAIGAVGTDMNIESYPVHANSHVWVFNAEPGKVTYLGALRVAWSDGEPSILADGSVKASDADDFVTRTFSNIPSHVVSGRMESIYMDMEGCSGRLLSHLNTGRERASTMSGS
jgi:hypothetical protein